LGLQPLPLHDALPISADGAGGHAGRFGQCSDRGTTHITRMMDDVLRRLAQGLPLQVRELGPEPLQRPRLGGGEGIVAVRCGRSAACCVIHASFLISCPLRYYVAPQISSLVASLAAAMASFAEASPRRPFSTSSEMASCICE